MVSSTTVAIGNGSLATFEKLVESAILARGVLWARTNLIYDSSKQDKYHFRPDNNYAKAPLYEYWNHGTTTPFTTDYQSQNPCAKVFPEGTWTMPLETATNQQLTALSNLPKTGTKTLVADGYRYSPEWERDLSHPENPAYPDNKLILSAYGYRMANSTTILTQHPDGANNANGQLHYWSGIIATSESNYALFTTVSGGTVNTSSTIASLNKREGRNIRCIRNI